MKVSIPQAVSAVATLRRWKEVRLAIPVSIPQAVSAVATAKKPFYEYRIVTPGFNTASGKCCCNFYIRDIFMPFIIIVSIPQAVSAVATAGSRKPVFKRFQKVVLENLKP